MLKSKNIEFEFPLYLSEKKEKEGKFIFEGFAAGNDFDLQNDIISDDALKNSIIAFKKEGEFRLNHTEEVIGKILECRFEKGKIWVKTEVTKKEIIKKVKSGELNCLSIKGWVNFQEKVELLPDLRLRLIKDLYLEEVSLVPQGANPEAKAIQWYVTKAIEIAQADKNMSKEINLNSTEDEFEAVTAGEDEKKIEEIKEEKIIEEKTEEVKEEKTEENNEKEEDDKNLSEKKEKKIVYQIMNSSNIELEDKKDLSEFKKELLRVGKWQHNAAKDGVLEITKGMLKTIVKNFKDKVLDNVSVPLGHPTTDDPSKNIGEVSNLELSKDRDKLIATIDVKDETVAEKIKKGLIKGISASFAEDYMNKDTGEKIGATLFHAALVGEPYIKKMGGFVPLSEDYKDSTVIPIINMDTSFMLSAMAERIANLEKMVELNENNNTSEETSEEKASEETFKEETPKEETTEENSKEATKEEVVLEESESSKVSEKTEEEEEDKTEKTSTEETKTEKDSEEAKANDEVELAEAEKNFEELLRQGRVTPAEKDLLLPLLASNAPVELADGKKVDIRKAMKKYLESKSPVFSLEEFGTTEGNKKNEKVPEDVKKEMDKMGLSEDIQEETYKTFKEEKEDKGKTEESTPF